MGVSQRILIAAAICLWACMAFSGPAQAAIAITCGTAGSFGTVNTQATFTSPNNITMTTAGAITYPGTLNGPATGTPITCTISGSTNGNNTVQVFCDTSRVITNSGGTGGQANRNMTAFTVSGTGKNTLASSACAGLTTAAGSFTVNGGQGATLNLGVTMDATNVAIGGTYQLSNNAAGPVDVKVTDVSAGTNATATANFTITFASLLGFSAVNNMAFGKIGFAGQPTSTDHADLGTDGTVVYAGGFNSGSGGAVNAGSVTMNNVQNGVTLEVRCDTSTTMTNGAGGSIQVNGLKVAAQGATGSYAGSGVACAGATAASPATTMVFNSGTANTFYIGGKLDGGTATAGFTGGNYSTANAGGVYANVNVVAQ
jgi:hypothetical protein